MQSIMFLKLTEDGPVDRILNLDRLSTASAHPDGGTRLIMDGFDIFMQMEFSEFIKWIENHIAENYRIANETSAIWHKKRTEDTHRIMVEAMKEAMNHHE